MERLMAFADDKEKMLDFFRMTKEEFLSSYSYLTEEEYEATSDAVAGVPLHNFIDPSVDAVFLPGKVHGGDDIVYIVYLNEDANEGQGSFEIDTLDAAHILRLYEDCQGNAKQFWYQIPSYVSASGYCDNAPDTANEFLKWCLDYFRADFYGTNDYDEMMFLVNWAAPIVRVVV